MFATICEGFRAKRVFVTKRTKHLWYNISKDVILHLTSFLWHQEYVALRQSCRRWNRMAAFAPKISLLYACKINAEHELLQKWAAQLGIVILNTKKSEPESLLERAYRKKVIQQCVVRVQIEPVVHCIAFLCGHGELYMNVFKPYLYRFSKSKKPLYYLNSNILYESQRLVRAIASLSSLSSENNFYGRLAPHRASFETNIHTEGMIKCISGSGTDSKTACTIDNLILPTTVTTKTSFAILSNCLGCEYKCSCLKRIINLLKTKAAAIKNDFANNDIKTPDLNLTDSDSASNSQNVIPLTIQNGYYAYNSLLFVFAVNTYQLYAFTTNTNILNNLMLDHRYKHKHAEYVQASVRYLKIIDKNFTHCKSTNVDLDFSIWKNIRCLHFVHWMSSSKMQFINAQNATYLTRVYVELARCGIRRCYQSLLLSNKNPLNECDMESKTEDFMGNIIHQLSLNCIPRSMSVLYECLNCHHQYLFESVTANNENKWNWIRQNLGTSKCK